jgi:hypothetical protein
MMKRKGLEKTQDHCYKRLRSRASTSKVNVERGRMLVLVLL